MAKRADSHNFQGAHVAVHTRIEPLGNSFETPSLPAASRHSNKMTTQSCRLTSSAYAEQLAKMLVTAFFVLNR